MQLPTRPGQQPHPAVGPASPRVVAPAHSDEDSAVEVEHVGADGGEDVGDDAYVSDGDGDGDGDSEDSGQGDGDLPSVFEADQNWQATIEMTLPAVVVIKTNKTRGFDGSPGGAGEATG